MFTLHLELMSNLTTSVSPVHAAMCRADSRSSMKSMSAPARHSKLMLQLQYILSGRVISKNLKLGGHRQISGVCEHARSVNLYLKNLNRKNWGARGGVDSPHPPTG